MIGLEEQIKLFKLIGSELEKKVECLVIGGSAMMFYGLKSSTKDVDLVLINKSAYESTKKVLKKIGFSERKHIAEKGYERIPALLERRDARFDLFYKKVIKFEISEGILERIKEIHEFDNFIAKIVSPEDIIVLKCATDREGDRIDARDIIEKFDIRWDLILKEILWQTENTKRPLNIFLYDFLVELKNDFKVKIPARIISELRKRSEDELMKLKNQK